MFGQYSHGRTAGKRWRKAEQLDAAGVHRPEWSRKKGHNRTAWRKGTRRGYILHGTTVAEYDSATGLLTLADGGWPTMTTRRAMMEARDALDLPCAYYGVSGNQPDSDHALRFGGWGGDNAIPFDRTLTVNIGTED